MSHYPECPRGQGKARAACACGPIAAALTNALERFDSIETAPFGSLTAHPDFRPLVHRIRDAIRGTVDD